MNKNPTNKHPLIMHLPSIASRPKLCFLRDFDPFLARMLEPPMRRIPPRLTLNIPSLISIFSAGGRRLFPRRRSPRTFSFPNCSVLPAWDIRPHGATRLGNDYRRWSRGRVAGSKRRVRTDAPFRGRWCSPFSSFSRDVSGRRCRHRPTCTRLHRWSVTFAVEATENGLVVVGGTVVEVRLVAGGHCFSILRMVKEEKRGENWRKILVIWFSVLVGRGRSSILLLFRRRCLNKERATLRPVETECCLVFEIGYVIHEWWENLSWNKVPLYYIFTNFDQQLMLNSFDYKWI